MFPKKELKVGNCGEKYKTINSDNYRMNVEETHLLEKSSL
jgi:hypothetical protein